MELRLTPLSVWLKSGAFAVTLHVAGALGIDYILWKGGFVYEVMGGQFALLLGWVWFLIATVSVLLSLRRWYYLDTLRVIGWVLGVAMTSAPLKAAGEVAMSPLLQAEYDAYPQRRAEVLGPHLRSRDVPESRIDSLIAYQSELFQAYRARQRVWTLNTWDKLKVMTLLGLILGLILGLLVRGGALGKPAHAGGTSKASA
jgi:hypothetical protein